MEHQERDEDGGVAVEEKHVGSYDDDSGPAQMAAVHQALMVYFGTKDWMEERNKKMPGIYRFFRPK